MSNFNPIQWAEDLSFSIDNTSRTEHPVCGLRRLQAAREEVGDNPADLLPLLTEEGDITADLTDKEACVLIEYACAALDAARIVADYLDKAEEAWEAGDLPAFLDAVEAASAAETEWGDDPTVQTYLDRKSLRIPLCVRHDAAVAGLPTDPESLARYKDLYEEAAEELSEAIGVGVNVVAVPAYDGPMIPAYDGPMNETVWQELHDARPWD